MHSVAGRIRYCVSPIAIATGSSNLNGVPLSAVLAQGQSHLRQTQSHSHSHSHHHLSSHSVGGAHHRSRTASANAPTTTAASRGDPNGMLPMGGVGIGGRGDRGNSSTSSLANMSSSDDDDADESKAQSRCVFGVRLVLAELLLANGFFNSSLVSFCQYFAFS